MKGKLIQNKYSVLQVLGQNAFSETFLAKDKNWFSHHRYVIKKFRPILGNPQAIAARRLFYQEASILKRLSGKNPQIPQLCEYFMDGEDFYIVRKWIDGITLKQKVQQQGKLSAAEVEQILDSILSFLEYIHSYGIVYCQLKPSSIILPRDRWLSRAKKLPVPIYFGGVKEPELEIEIERRGLVLAHQQEYISPEQERGSSVYASDLYSLGLTTIYLLTAKTPAQLPLDPRTKRLLWHREVPDLKIYLVRVIDRAISPNVSDRFSSASQMLRALHSRPVSISERVVDASTHKPLLTSEVKVISSLFLIGLGVLGLAYILLNSSLASLFERDFASESAEISQNSSTYSDRQLEVEDKETEYGIQHNDRSGVTEIPQVATSANKSPCYSKKSCSAIEAIYIPAFTVGTLQQEIISSLGEPSLKSKGYWQNSNAFLYRFIPDRIDLGYLLDVDAKIVRQTEITFAESVDLLTIQQAAQRLLLDNYSPEIEHHLNQIYLNNSDRHEFETDRLEGVIERNSSNHIYLGIWDSAFH